MCRGAASVSGQPLGMAARTGTGRPRSSPGVMAVSCAATEITTGSARSNAGPVVRAVGYQPLGHRVGPARSPVPRPRGGQK
jgi:hypothetical protein